MSAWEAQIGATDEWYTPKYIFDALGCKFDLDVAPASVGGNAHVPANAGLSSGLEDPWFGFVWMNPPFGGRGDKAPWLNKFFSHGNGIALLPDRTSAQWWQDAARRSDALLMMSPKVKFLRPDGSRGEHPSCGTTLFAKGGQALEAFRRAGSLGLMVAANR